QQGLAVDLADAALADVEHGADLAQVQLLLVVQRQHQALALGQVADRLRQLFLEFAVLQFLLRAGAAVGRVEVAVVLAAARAHRQHAALRRVLQAAVILFQLDAEPAGHLAVAGLAAGLLLDGVHRRADLALAPVQRARRPVAAAQLVEHGAADADAGIGFERGAVGAAEVARRLQQADQAGLDQVAGVDARRQARHQVIGDAPHQVAVPLYQLGLVHRRLGEELRLRAHTGTAAGERCTRRSTKNSRLPRGPGGRLQRSALAARSAKARAEGLFG